MYGNPYGQQNQMANMQMANMQMGAMGAGSMGMLGMGGMGGAGTFFYVGNSVGLETKLDDIRNHPNQYTDANIMVTGNQVKEMRICLMVLTYIAGGFCILPYFFMCCDWWKACVNPAYSVPLSTYQKLQNLICNSSVRSLTLRVQDNNFNKPKAIALYNLLSRSQIKGFTFVNSATPNNYTQNQYSDFKDNMKPIKSLSMLTDLKWYTQIVL